MLRDIDPDGANLVHGWLLFWCVVGIEACGTAHFWAREIARCGHDVRLMPPGYVKPYVKRNKHDAVVAPDGTGDINNYTVIYVTNNRALAEHFQTAGLPAVFDPQLTYEYTPDSSGVSGQLYVTAAGEELPVYFLFETDPPPNSQQSFS